MAGKSMDPVNQNLRAGAARALAVLGTMAGVHAVVVASYVSRLEPPGRWVWLGASIVVGTALIAATWGALRTLKTRLTEEGVVVDGLTETMAVRWDDVVRLRREHGRIVLERIGAPSAVISLWYVSQPDELHATIRNLVPNRALQRAGA